MLALPERVEEAVVGSVHAAKTNEPEFISLAEMEKRLISETLIKCDGNQTLAAQKLGVSRSTLWRKMKEYQIKNALPSEEATAG
jgi:DNA-binding NtrC family response regulator